MKSPFEKAGLFCVILLLVEVVGAGAACTGTQLGTKNPTAGETIRIHTGECAGIINIAHDDTAVFFEPGSGIQDNCYIGFPSTGILNNITMDVRGVIWALNQGLFYSGVHHAGLKLMYSTFYFWNSTFSSSHFTTIGLLSGGSRSSASGPSLVRSTFTVAQCQLSTNAAGRETLGLFFGGTLTNSLLIISGGSSVSATTTSGNYRAYGIYFKGIITNSTLEMTHRSVVQVTSSYPAHGIWFSSAFTDSTLKMMHGSVVQATSSNNAAYTIVFDAAFTDSTLSIISGSVQATGSGSAYAILFRRFFTDSTLSISDNSTIVANGPGTLTTAVYFDKRASVTRPTITIANSVVQSTKYSFSHHPAAFVSNKIGTITLCLSSFSGPSDGIGPLTGTTIQHHGNGILTIGTIYWNSVSQLLTPAMLLPTYTSSQLTIEGKCPTLTLEPTESATKSETNSETASATITTAPTPAATLPHTATSHRTISQTIVPPKPARTLTPTAVVAPATPTPTTAGPTFTPTGVVTTGGNGSGTNPTLPPQIDITVTVVSSSQGQASSSSEASSDLELLPKETEVPIPAAQEQATATVTAGATVVSSLASGGSAGAAADVQGLLVVGLSSCSPPLLKGVAKSGKRAVVPWTLSGTGTNLGGLLGCLTLLAGILAFHFVATAMYYRAVPQKCDHKFGVAIGKSRFPGRSFTFAGILWQGVSLETASLMIDGDVPVSEKLVAILIFLFFLALPVGLFIYAKRLPSDDAEFVPIDRKNLGFFKRQFLPAGFWVVPDPKVQRFKGAFSPFRSSTFSYFYLILAARSIVLAVIVIVLAESLSCLMSTILLAATFFFTWLPLIILRPGVHPVAMWGTTLMTWITIAVIILSQMDGEVYATVTGWLVTASGMIALLLIIPLFISNRVRKKYKKEWKLTQQPRSGVPPSGTTAAPTTTTPGASAILVPPVAHGAPAPPPPPPPPRSTANPLLSSPLLGIRAPRGESKTAGRSRSSTARKVAHDTDDVEEMTQVYNPLVKASSSSNSRRNSGRRK